MGPSIGVSDAVYYLKIKRLLNKAKNKKLLYDSIVNAPFHDPYHTTSLGIGFLSFVLVNKSTGTIDRISISKTEPARGAIDITVKPFDDLKVPISYKGNIVAESIEKGHIRQTNDWNLLLTPVLKPEESRLNQAGAGIAHSYIYPLDGTANRGAIIFQYFITSDQIGKKQRHFMKNYTKIVSQVLAKTKS